MIRKGDLVKVAAGKDKGKQGKILQVFPALDRAQVEGVNILVKHIRSQRKGTPGQKVEFPSPLHMSNLQLICQGCSKPVRAGHVTEEGKKYRICKKCKERI